MNLSNLRYFIAVVDAGTFSGAARTEFVSQQALSEQVRRLEAHFHTPLLERTNPVRLTPAGQLVYDTACEVTKRICWLEDHLQRLAQRQETRLVISTGMVGTPPFLPQLILQLKEQMPAAELIMIHPSSSEKELTAPPPEADLLVGNMPFDDGIDAIELLRDPLCVVLSVGLLEKEFGSAWREREDELKSFVCLKDWINTGIPLDKQKAGPIHDGPAAVNNLELICHFCRLGQCAVILPWHFSNNTFGKEEGMRIYPLPEEEGGFNLGIGLRHGEPRSRVTEEFIRIAQAYFQQETMIGPQVIQAE